METMPPRIIAYRRISKEGGTGLGLAAQAKAIREEAKRLGLPIYETHTDDGVSGGAKIEKRVALLAALSALRKGDVLVIAKRDRLARDVMIALWIEKEAMKRGARIVSAAGEANGDPDDPYLKAMRSMMAVFAELERDLIRGRTKSALAVRRAAGERWCNVAPYGYRWTADDKLAPDAKEQRTIKLVKKLRGEGVALRGIVAELKKGRRLNRNNKPIGLSQVVVMLKPIVSH